MYITENMSFSVHSPSLRQIVGIHQDVYSTPEEEGPHYYYTKTAESVVDMAQGFYALYVYTNVVASTARKERQGTSGQPQLPCGRRQILQFPRNLKHYRCLLALPWTVSVVLVHNLY